MVKDDQKKYTDPQKIDKGSQLNVSEHENN
jgi:hypothetical protein